MEEFVFAFCKNMHKWARVLGISETQLSRETGVSSKSLHNYRLGKTMPTVRIFAELYDYFLKEMKKQFPSNYKYVFPEFKELV